MIGAPAGQPEFVEWIDTIGASGAGIPFLSYMPTTLGTRGQHVDTALRQLLGQRPSFVAFEAYDTITVLAEMLRSHGPDRETLAQAWRHVSVEGTRGHIGFSRRPGDNIWQWTTPPIQVVDRDPTAPDQLRILHAD